MEPTSRWKISKGVTLFYIGAFSALAFAAVVGIHMSQIPPLLSAERIINANDVREASRTCGLSKGDPTRGVFGLAGHYGDEAVLDLVAEAGVSWIRTSIHWPSLNPNEGGYNWGHYDWLVRGARERGISIQFALNGYPERVETWEEFYGELETFVSEVVERYRPDGVLAHEEEWDSYGVQYWEVFNEPNLPGLGWLEWGVDPLSYVNEYAMALIVSNNAIREIYPEAFILLGGLSSHKPSYEYLERLYELDVANCFDVLAYHPYDEKGRFSEVHDELEEINASYGTTKTIWFNEYGVDRPEVMSEYMEQALAEKDDVPAVFWYTLFEPVGERRMSLFEEIDEPREAYFILKEHMKDADTDL